MAVNWVAIRARMMRHRWKLIDGSAVLIVTALAAFCAYEYDLFRTVGLSAVEERIELDELMAVATLFCGVMVLFCMRRLKEARRETARRIEAERAARTLALHDALTGLPNRRQFDEALNVAIAAPPRSGAAHVLLMMDLNGFKRINDVFGHQAGDEVLMQVGGRLNRMLRDGDLAARLGGDEFAVLASHVAGAEAATGLALRIIEALEPPIVAGGGEHRIGVAIGIVLTPQDGIVADELVRKADIALYRAKAEKHRTGSAMRFFEDAMDGMVRDRDRLERALRTAIRDRAIRPHYQPLVALDGNAVVGFEAVAQWFSPELGVVPPERFLAVAEDCGLIGPLTVLLLEAACRDATRWPDGVTLSFDLPGAILQDRGFGARVLTALAETGLAPARLELEITESALVRDLEAARAMLATLRGAGVRIALDDFGTGYSSLYHLRTVKPDRIKIDRSFVEGMESDPDNAAIVQALIGLGSGLGAKITAEGVETSAQEALLRDQGCDQGQGRLFSRAVDADAALAMLARPGARRAA